MKKAVLPRIVGLLFLYIAVFIILVTIQFTRRGGFTQQIGNFVISGYYRQAEGPGILADNEYLLAGEINIFFGGMEFRLTNDDDNDSLGTIKSGGRKELVHPDSMTVSGESVQFRLSDGTGLSFATQYYGGVLELRIRALFLDDVEILELPYRPLRTSRTRDGGEEGIIIVSDGISYRFNNAVLDSERRLIVLDTQNPVLSYGAVPVNKTFDPADYILASAQDKQSYDETLNRWREHSFSLWNRTIGNMSNEDTVIAYLGESIHRGTYKAAVSGISSAFLEGNQRGYESTVFLGRMDIGRRSIAAYERDQFSRLSRLINEKSPNFLRDPHVLEYLEIRGYGNLIDDGAGIVRTIDPASLTLDLAPGILEAYEDWDHIRPNTQNPFERLIDQVCFVISEGLRMDPDRSGVFVFSQEEADPEFNVRLGTALASAGEHADRKDWAGIGRSLVLSILSLTESSGANSPTGVFGPLTVSWDGSITSEAGGNVLSTGRIYRILQRGTRQQNFRHEDYQARAVSIGDASNGVWTWTAASEVQTAYSRNEAGNTILDISVSFPAGETHYMIIRGIRPFAQLQLYNIPFRTDPQFERYDSSGWAYFASEQTLVLKMKHRSAVEHIEIFY
jgi:hypothetical protein